MNKASKIGRRDSAVGVPADREMQLRTLIANLPGAVYRQDASAESVYLFVSNGIFDIAGRRPEEIVGRSHRLICHPDDWKEGRRLFLERIGRSHPYVHEYRIRRSDGSVCWVQERARGVPGPDGTLMFVDGVLLDITDRKKAETALRESKRRYREILDESPIAAWEDDWSAIKRTVDRLRAEGTDDLRAYFERFPHRLHELYLQRRIVDVSAAAVVVYGARDKAELIAQYFLRPPTEDKIRGFRGAVLRFAAGELSAEYEAVDCRLDGSPIVLQNRAIVPSHCRGDWSCVLFTFEDVTERRQAERALAESEARMRAVFDNAADGIVTIDESGIIDSFNPAAAKIFGYAPGGVVGKSVALLMPEPERSRHDGYVRRYLETGRGRVIGIGPREVTGLRADGSLFPMDLAVSEMRVNGRRLFIGIARDISRRKETERRLQQAVKMEAVGQLTGGIAHDFNNLLTVILGNLELLEGHVRQDRPERKLLATARRAVDRGADLTRRLLAFSRRQALKPEATDVNALISEAIELLRRTLGEQVSIETALSDALWPAMVDGGQLESALLNLAINARDAMPGGGRLGIETVNVELDADYAARHADVVPGRYVSVAVSDTGSGMAPDVLARVFEPFFTTKAPGKGSGLGLSMVFGFVKQSGGHVNISSEVGRGTTVNLFLPRAETVAAAHPSAPSLPTLSGSETVLIVEDDPDVRELAARHLQSLGYTVHAAADGPSALAQLSELEKIDLVFSDVVLPGGMNGRELAHEVQKRRPGTPVLHTSGYAETAVVQHGRLEAGVELIAKPYRKEDLARAVRQVLNGPKAAQTGAKVQAAQDRVRPR